MIKKELNPDHVDKYCFRCGQATVEKLEDVTYDTKMGYKIHHIRRICPTGRGWFDHSYHSGEEGCMSPL